MVEYKSYARVFVTTFQVSILTTLLCILIGYPLAYFLAMLPQRMAGFFMLAVLLPFWTSLLVRTYAWLVLLQKNGILNDFAISAGIWETPVKLVHNMTGTLIGMAHIMLPFLVLPLYGAMRKIERDMMHAAANLGATPIQAFWKMHGGGIVNRVRALPRLLCHTRSSWRRARGNGCHPDYGNTRKPVQLGCGKRTRRRAIGGDYCDSLPGRSLSKTRCRTLR
jgi:ABC-type sulfate transport system permease component